MKIKLPLHEKLYWLNIDDNRKKKIHTRYEAKYLYGLAGLALFELLLNKHIEWKDKDKLQGVMNNPPQDDLLLEIWQLCTTPKKISWFWLVGKNQEVAHSVKDWLVAIAGKVSKFTTRIEEKLIQKSIIRLTEPKVLAILQGQQIHLINPEDQAAYKNYLNDVINKHQEPTVGDLVLLKVLKACKLHKLIYLEKDNKKLTAFYDSLVLWASQKIDNEQIVKYLAALEMEKDLDDLIESLDSLADMIDSLADAIGDAGDAGGDSGGDGGDGGGGGD
jgi:RNase P/RNase MRP subunit p29